MRGIYVILMLLMSYSVFGQVPVRLRGNSGRNMIEVTVGDNDNYTIIDTNGIRMYGDATQWTDMTISALSLAGGVQAPSIRAVLGGIGSLAFNFNVANDIAYGVIQMPHGWIYDDSIEVHIHCFIETTPSAGDTVVIDFEYTFVDIDEVIPTTDTIQVEIPVAAWTAKQHKMIQIGWLQGADKTMSANIPFRIERRRDLDSDTYDAANNWFHLMDLDVHYRVDKFGSNEEDND